MELEDMRETGRTTRMLVAAIKRARQGNFVVVFAQKGEVFKMFEKILKLIKPKNGTLKAKDVLSTNAAQANVTFINHNTLTVHSCVRLDKSMLQEPGIPKEDSFIDHKIIEKHYGFVLNQYLPYIVEPC